MGFREQARTWGSAFIREEGGVPLRFTVAVNLKPKSMNWSAGREKQGPSSSQLSGLPRLSHRKLHSWGRQFLT